MLKLVIQDDEGKTTVVPLVHDEITIGRQEGNTIRLTERNVSRRHARLRQVNGSLTIEDLESYNGVRINGNPVEGTASLSESDRVQIGDYLLELRPEDVERADSEQATQKLAREGEEAAAQEEEAEEGAQTVPMPALDSSSSPEESAEGDGGAASESAKAAAPQASEANGATPPGSGPGTDAGAVAVAPAQAPVQSSTTTSPTKPLTAAKAPKDTAAAGEYGKLVVLSTNFAGRELSLDKPSVVIGRTPENDICLDHRSISRHHAKIIREDDRYAIVDLQSSNGVRVNGEEYGKVELRRGDVVDLGHVRMRFVEPGEDFVFGRDAQPVDLEVGRRRGVVWAVVAVLLLGGSAGVFAIAGGEDDTAVAEEEATEEPIAAEADEAEVEEPEADSESEGEELGAEKSDEMAAHLEAASEAVAEDRWEDALAEAEEALALDAANERARSLAAQAEEELGNRERYEAFQDAVEAGDFEQVATGFEAIGRESVYRVKAQDDHDRMRDEYIEQVEARARQAARRGACGRVDRIASEAEALWPEAGEAARVSCDRVVAEAPDRGQTSAATEEEEPADEGEGESEPDTEGPAETSGAEDDAPEQSVEEVVEEAQGAARAGEFGRALRLCEDVLRRSPGHSEALMVCLISACNLRNESKAERYMSQISGDQRIHARQVCLRHGVDVE